ncbi:MAG: hypothetical protein M5R37_00455 [Melioribacteraceae bacterium]|nr:hypothetical protein [Melioribacteraceae bacterium]
MYKLSFILVLFSLSLMAQAPHGDGFSLDCSICHTAQSWKVDFDKISFDHSQTKFELLGQHKIVNCTDCHESLVFKNVNNNCFECHFDIHETTVGTECEVCHNNNSWVVTNIKEIHDLGRFPLVGNHAIADCEDCHISVSDLRFEPLGSACYDCHKVDYNSTLNPNHALSGFSTDCEECHSLTDSEWSVAAFAHEFFPLIGGHQISNCFECHSQNTFSGLNSECFQCHQADYENAQIINHVALGFDTDCSICHSLNPGWSPATFANHNDIYPLIGAHAAIASDCNQCHSTGYNNTPNQCIGCHESDYNSTTNPSHITLNFSTNCEECHSQNAWTPATFDHDAQFFPIYSGEHNGEWSACSDCHIDANNYAVFSCTNCHEHNKTDMDDEHIGINGYIYESSACLSCHPTGSGEGGFNHNTTNFPLTGSHITVDCQACHISGYQGTSILCEDCHQDDYLNAPDHTSLGYPMDCERCHSTTAWEVSTFNHSNTNFPLTGAHVTQICSDCHSAGFEGTSTLCFYCHTDEFNSAMNPNHQNLGLSNQCDECHTTDPGWSPAQFPNHNDYFVLLGAHLTVPSCADCHTIDYNTTPNQCIGCHESDYDSTTDPAHRSAGFTTDCEVCHNETSWTPATFDHDAQFFPIYSGEHNGEWNACSDCHTNQNNYSEFVCTNCHEHNKTDMDNEHTGVEGYVFLSQECFACHPNGTAEGAFNHANSNFPLTGAHTNLLCEDCHQNGYLGTSSLCFDCHNNNYNSSQNPSHSILVLSQTCEECHSTDVWIPSTFNHSTTGFELIGGHQIPDCSSCHTTDVSTTQNICFACHENDYSIAPDHSSLGYPTACEQCHVTTSWQETTFDHNGTNFPLTGAHIGESCASCHSDGFSGTSTVCYDCHTNDFNLSSNPDHQQIGLGTQCDDCHTTNPDWSPAEFPVHDNFYQLIGAHAAISSNCIDCHNGDYNNTPNTCFQCHQSDYNSTTDPSHSAAQFPTDCEQCHSQNAWEPSTFNHDGQYFPIYSGEHQNEWNSCSDCHTNAANYSVFSCIDCHEHNQTEMDSKHNDVSGYVYESVACYECHPDGKAGNVTFPSLKDSEF